MTPAAEPAHDPYAALRHRDYRFLLAGSILASIGSEVQAVAVGWELWQRTHDAAALGYVGLVQFLPVLLLSLPAGHVTDRHSRKGLLLVSQALTALVSLAFAALSWWQGPLLAIYFFLLLAGCCRAFSAPARWALVPMVVPAPVLNNAVTWNSSGWQIAAATGPALGGFVIYALGGQATGNYFLAAGCALACALLIALVRPQGAPPPARAASLESLLAGVRFVWRTKLILATITLDLFAVLFGGATILLPVFATDILHVGATGLGWLRASPALGALLMALVLAHRPPLRRAGRALLVSVAGFGLATVVFGLSENFWLSFAMLALTGALDNVSVVVRGTLVQVLTPDEMRGRVLAVNAVFISSSNELGGFESGVTAKLWGPVASVVVGGVGTVVVVGAVMLCWPEVMRLGSLHTAATEIEEEERRAAARAV